MPGALFKLRRLCADAHGVNGQRAEVEIYDTQRRAHADDCDPRLGAREFRELVVEGERDIVVDRPPTFVEAFVPRARGRGAAQKAKQRGPESVKSLRIALG